MDRVLESAALDAVDAKRGPGLVCGEDLAFWLTPVLDGLSDLGANVPELRDLIVERLTLSFKKMKLLEVPKLSVQTLYKGRTKANREFGHPHVRAKIFQAFPHLMTEIPLCQEEAEITLKDALRAAFGFSGTSESASLEPSLSPQMEKLLSRRAVQEKAARLAAFGPRDDDIPQQAPSGDKPFVSEKEPTTSLQEPDASDALTKIQAQTKSQAPEGDEETEEERIERIERNKREMDQAISPTRPTKPRINLGSLEETAKKGMKHDG
ncbi:hypothetical protein [Sabulicella glaciei]|nr:hypothetical protein [Roseococcus sp. MDT2-1-1]